MIQPVFLLSLPRSGSTLVQRFLAGSREIATTSEPWLLLPIVFARHGTSLTVYGQSTAAQALNEFVAQLPDGDDDWRRAVGRFARDLYGRRATGGERLFLDKTPRYFLIWEELLRIFPESKIIVLVRNPLAVAASIIETWGAGTWNLFRYETDLELGIRAVARAYASDDPRIVRLTYEDFVRDPRSAGTELCAALDVPFEEEMIAGIGKRLIEGRFGDQTGADSSVGVTTARLHVWPERFRSPLRRRWTSRWLRRQACEFETLGFSPAELEREMTSLPLRRDIGDVPRFALGSVYRRLSPEGRYLLDRYVRRRTRPFFSARRSRPRP